MSLRKLLPAALIAAAALSVLPALRAPAAPPAAVLQEEAELIEQLRRGRDLADPQLVKDLALKRTRTAMQALLDYYDQISTIWMRREVVRALAKFDGVPDAEQPALQRIMDVATNSPDVELRTAAVDALGDCSTKGKDFLVMIVESAAEDSIRERAMKAHLRLHDKSDEKWYRELYDQKKKDTEAEAEKPGKGKGKDRDKGKDKGKDKGEAPADEGPKKGAPLNPIRLMAFEAITSGGEADWLVEACKDRYWEIRAAAIAELERRQDKRLEELAEEFYEHDGRADNQILGAKILAGLRGPKFADDLIKRGRRVDIGLKLRRGLAEVVAGMADEKVNRELIELLTKGKSTERLFALEACRTLQDDKVVKGLVKALSDKSPDVVVQAAEILAERKEVEAADDLKKLVGKGKDKQVQRAALTALTAIKSSDPAWFDELVAMTKSEDPETRALALDALGSSADSKALEYVITALHDPNWSTRLAALQSLERMRNKAALGAIITRMDQENGRMLQEFALTLWRLTGQGFQDNPTGWQSWWKDAEPRFEFISASALEKIKTGEEEWRLKQQTRVESKFFGIRIVSHKVIFIIDVSGSMVELLECEYGGQTGHERIDVAKKEMVKCLEGLDEGAFFNIVTFSGDAARWLEGGLAAANEKNRDDATKFVEALLPFGGTNLYAAMQMAFRDPDVDTIFVMSDGEPSVGEVIDPLRIREHVAQWNEHRRIQINTIAVGGQFSILEWLAEDSGGTHVKFE